MRNGNEILHVPLEHPLYQDERNGCEKSSLRPQDLSTVRRGSGRQEAQLGTDPVHGSEVFWADTGQPTLPAWGIGETSE